MTKYEMVLQVTHDVSHIKEVKPENCFEWAASTTEDILNGYLLAYKLEPERDVRISGIRFNTISKWDKKKNKYVPLELYDGTHITLELRGAFHTKDDSDNALSEMIPEMLSDPYLGYVEGSLQLYKLVALEF